MVGRGPVGYICIMKKRRKAQQGGHLHFRRQEG